MEVNKTRMRSNYKLLVFIHRVVIQNNALPQDHQTINYLFLF